MGVQERKEREREEMRELILNAASQIASQEGIEGISIRKIANKIDYSSTIIYHYFKDKDEIINYLMNKSYKKIIEVLSSVKINENSPDETLKESIRKYIYLALEMPDEYKNMLLTSSQSILEYTSVLIEGAAIKRQAIGMLCKGIQEIYKNRGMEDYKAELSAQIIWTATFGLIIRLIIEKDILEEQKKKLIERHIEFIVKGI